MSPNTSIGQTFGWELCNMISRDHVDMQEFERLLDQADLHVKLKPDNKDAVTIASECGKVDILKLLVAKGAPVDSGDSHGNTALILSKNTEIVRILLQAGASVNTANAHGTTPLMSKLYNGELESADLLLNALANPFLVNKSGLDALTMLDRGHRKNSPEVMAGRALMVKKINMAMTTYAERCGKHMAEIKSTMPHNRPRLVVKSRGMQP